MFNFLINYSYLGGQTASFALKKIKRSELRKGMYLVSEKLNPISSTTWGIN